MNHASSRAFAAEAIGSALLLAGVIGSGIMAERLSGGNVGLALLANAIATGGVLYALISVLGPVSGAHFNPLVTFWFAWRGALPRGLVPGYLVAQIAGAIAGAWIANLMFDLPVLHLATKLRGGLGQWTGEFVATFGLLALIAIGERRASASLPAVVACYIVGAYWFTSSTSFANPSVTIARAFSDSFAGIAPASVPGFVVAQILGALAAALVAAWVLTGESVKQPSD